MVVLTAVLAFLCGTLFQGAHGQFTATIVSNPAGTPVSGSTNTFDYPILSSVTLTCMVDPSPTASVAYQWNSEECFANRASPNAACFPRGQVTQSVTGNNLLAKDSGTITCTVTTDGDDYTSGPLTLRISGTAISQASGTPGEDFVANKKITDYSYFTSPFSKATDNSIFRCASGLVPSGRSTDLGGWYFNRTKIDIGTNCISPNVVEIRPANGNRFPGIVNLYLCVPFSTTEEGVYSCIMMTSSMMEQTMRVGMYLSGRTAPMIDSPLSTIRIALETSVTLSCTSRGSPPDTFTFMKDDMPLTPSPSVTTVIHTENMAVFQINYTINSVTEDNAGTYTCTVTNPIGSDSKNITVVIAAGPPDNVRVIVIAARRAEVTWDQSLSPVATGYHISYTTTASYTSGGSVIVTGRSTTSVTLTNLEENTPYTITVQTNSSDTLSSNSDVEVITTWTDVPSSPPQNVMVTSVNPSSLGVSWQPPPEIDHNGIITGYIVEYTRNGGSSDNVTVNVGFDTRLIELDPFVSYSVRVTAMTLNGTGPFNNPPIVETSGQDKPTMPRLPMVDSVTATTVTLSWMTPDPPNGMITFYELEYRGCSSTSGNYMPLQPLNSAVTRTVMGLTSNTEYCFRVRAYTVARLGASPWTNEVRGRTYGPPTNVDVVVLSPRSIKVTWDPPLVNVNSYIISYIGMEDFADDGMVTVNRSPTRTTIDVLEEFVSYEITVQAVYNTINIPSNSVRVRTWSDVPDGPPRDIRLMDTDPAMLSVTYIRPLAINRNGDVTGYVIRYTRVGSGVSQMITVGGGNVAGRRTSVLPGLMTFTEYSVEVAAVNDNGTGPYSNAVTRVSGQDRPSAPHSLSSSMVQSTSVSLSWMAPGTTNGMITRYEVEYASNDETLLTSVSNNTLLEGLSSGTMYTIRIRAYTRVGAGEFSNSVTITTRAEPPAAVDITIPVQSISSSMLIINWMEPFVPNGDITHYTVFYLPVSGPYGSIMTSNRRKRQVAQNGEFAMNFTETSGTLTNLNGSVTYRIEVLAAAVYNGERLFGQRSVPEMVTTLEGTPTEPRDASNTSTRSSISLSWQRPDPPNGLITNYTVSYNAMKTFYNQDTDQMETFSDINSTSIEVDDVNTSVSLNLAGLRPGTEYQFTIVAYTNVGPGNEAMISVSTLPDVPRMPEQPQLPTGDADITATAIKITIQRASDINGPIMYYAVIVIINGDENSTANEKDIGPYDNEQANLAISSNLPYTYIAGIVATNDISDPYIVGNGMRSSIGEESYVNVRLQSNTMYALLIRAYATDDLFSTSSSVSVSTAGGGGGGGDGGGSAGIIIGVIVAIIVVAVIVVVIIVVVLYMRRRDRESAFLGKKSDMEDSSVVALKDMTDHGKSAGSFEPEIIGLPKDLVATEGQSFTFPSHVTGKPEPDVYWYLNSKDMTENDDIVISSNGQLTLTVVRTDHEGEWRCQATSSSGSSEVRTNLTVKSTKAKPLPSPRPGRRHKPIPTDEFGVHVNMLHENSNQGFKDEYESFYNGQDMSTAVGSAPSNKFKNRFANIVAYDNNRVALVPCGQYKDDYVNASPVDGYQHPKYFIAAQAPVNKTLTDFWRLIWQEHPPTIVMVTNLKEGEKVKCVQYWPNAVGESLTFGPLRIHMSEEFEFADYVVRTIELKNAEQRNRLHVVTQYHFTSWPDHGVPEYATAMLAFHRRVRADHHSSIGPMMVHCSAGVGRTGTFITIDIALEQVKAEGVVDIYNIVNKLRRQRPHMVQALEQYMFIHDGILESITCGNTQVSAPDLQRMVTKLKQRDPHTNLTGYEQQFKVLEQVSPRVEEQVSNSALRNPDKNRPNHCPPMEKGRVILRKEKPDYINAAFLKGYKQDKAFIVAQSPMQNTVRDFWKMMVDRQCACVVMLCELEEGGQEACAPYWPETGSFTYGDIVVANINVIEAKEFSTRVFKVTDKKANVTHQVTQFHMHSWDAHKSPASNAGILAMIEEVQKVQRGTGNKPIVVHCSNVLGRTGTFCVLFTILDRFKVEQVVDVLQTVKLLRIKRPGVVEDLDQYQFIYSTVLRYLQSFDTYDNFKI